MKKRSLVAVLICAAILGGCQQKKEVIDNYYEKVNEQWLEENKDYAGVSYGAYEEQENKVERLLDAYLQELSEQQDSNPESLSEIEQKAVILYEQTLDTKKRNELGAQPIQGMLQKVEQVSDLEGLTALYKDDRMSCFNTLFQLRVEKNMADGTYQVYVDPMTICGQYGMLSEAQFTGYKALIIQEAMLAGYDEQRAAEIAEHALTIERKVLAMNCNNLQDYSKYANKGMEAILNRLPLEEIAKERGYLEERSVLICSQTHLKLLQELFVEENKDILKDYYLAAFIVKSAPYLGEDMSNCYWTALNTLMGSSENENTYEGYQVVKAIMEDFLAEYYMEEYVGEEMEQEVRDMAEAIRGELKEKIETADWMSEQTKTYAIEKLEAMQLFVGLPEKMHDYSTLEVTTYEEGGNLIENFINAYINNSSFQKEFLKEESANAYYFNPLEVNATYAQQYNAFAINAAIITMDGCNKETQYEEKLATLGFFIAHEISHGFDGAGSNFTAEGIYKNWWTAEDKAAYRERINRVKHYFDEMEVEDGLILVGENIMDEAYADLSAMSVCMDLLEAKEKCDYKLFFESYAKLHRSVQTDEYLAYLVANDTHLPNEIRVNQVLNQMDEFYEIYEVTEDSSLYVKEEERLQVWE